MPFPVDEKYIKEIEVELEVKFPHSFKEKMEVFNGGEIEKEDFFIQLVPFFDKSDKKRLSRTCNHIGLETKNARKWEGFPENAVVIGLDDFGNKLIFTHNGNGMLSENVFIWNHETGKTEKIAESVSELID